MSELPQSGSRPDPKAIVFLLITLGLVALELWGILRIL
jgi:hypothetical protein